MNVHRPHTSGFASHDGHEVVTVSGRRDSGEIIGLLLCMTCSRVVRRLALCGAPTKRGAPCRVYVRDDLGFRRCWSHGDGAGRTSTPRLTKPARVRALGLGPLSDERRPLSRRDL
jgi:hypothetical protein